MKLTEEEKKILDTYDAVKIGIIGFTGESEELVHKNPDGGVPCAVKFAVQEAFENRKLPRRVEFIYKVENGLPQGSALNSVKAYHELCDEGCLLVVGPHSSDNIYMMKDASDERKVPVISWAGSESLSGEYLFRLGNGDCGGDPALIAQWVEKKGYRKIGVIEEICPNGEEYMRYFKFECRERDLLVCATETLNQFDGPETVEAALQRLKDAGTEVVVYIGYGYLLAQNMLNPAFKAIGWDPARITTTAFMYYLKGYEFFEGWVGIDQDCPDNKLRQHFAEKFFEAYKDKLYLAYRQDWLNGVQLLSYDTGRVIAEALFRAPVLTPEGVKKGLERIRWMPSAVGGNNNHISCSAYEHNMYSGDWLCYGKIQNGKLEFEGLYND